MDEEYTDSVDISADMDVSDVDIDGDIPDDVPEDDYSDADVSDNVSEDILEETEADDIEYEETEESVEEDSIETETDEMGEYIDDFDEDILEESEESSEGDVEIDDIPEDSDGFEENQGNEADEIEYIPEDTESNEVVDQVESYEEDVSEDVTDTEAADEATDAEDADTVKWLEEVTKIEVADEATDAEDADTAKQQEEVTNIETTDETLDVEDTDTVEQQEEVTDTETIDKTTDAEDIDATEQLEEITDTETTDETSDVEDTDMANQPEKATDTEEAEEATDVEDTNAVEQSKDVTDTEAMEKATATDETSDVEDIDTAKQPEEVTDTEMIDGEDADVAEQSGNGNDLEDYDYEASSETLGAVNPEISGEDTDDVGFTDASHLSDQPTVEKTADTTAINSILDYMNAHNYGLDDFATYSQDPQWRQLMRQEYPDYELPEMTQESASAQLFQYMNNHNYGMDDYAEYSQDPIWRELHSTAYPDDELPPLNDSKNEQQRPIIGSSGGGNPSVCPICGQNPCVCNLDSNDASPPPDDSSKVLKYDEFDLLKSGNNAINQHLENQAGDYRDKGLSQEEISDRFATDKRVFQKEFLDDAFPGEDVVVADDKTSEYNKTLKDFCESKRYVKIADFSDFDSHVAYDLAQSVIDAKSDFPDLEVNYLGSIDHQVKGLHDTVEASQFDFYKQNGFDEGLAQQMAKQYADDFISNNKLDDTKGTYAWSLRTGNPSLDKFDGVAVNNDYAKDYIRFKNEKQADEIARWAPLGCGSPKAVADHEMGHEIDNLLGASNDSRIVDLYSNMMKENKAEEVLSGYSKKNVKEFIAEAYSEYRNNSNPREVSRAVYNRLIELRDQKILARRLS